MIETIEANWLVALVVLLAVVAVAWLVWGRGPKVRQRAVSRDVLDEGAAPAARNSALIDAPPAAAIVPPPVSVGLAGIGELVSEAAEQEVSAAPAPAPPPAGATQGDDLSRIKGLGPKLQALLPTLGLTTYARIAALTEADLADLDSKLGAFAGRPKRDNWMEQARLLADGDTGAYEAKFGKL